MSHSTEPVTFEPTLVHEWLTRAAARHPDKTALVSDGARWSYRALDEASSDLACGLAKAGFARHDRAVIFMDNCADAVIALYGVLKAGGVFAVVSGALKPPKLAHILENSGARVLMTHSTKSLVVTEAFRRTAPCMSVWLGGDNVPAMAGEVRRWEDVAGEGRTLRLGGGWTLPRVIDADLACLIYTSGSTGEPKGVMCAHHNMVGAARSIARYIGNVGDDVILDVLPISFDYGLYQVLMSVMFGGTVVLERSFMYLHPILETIARERVTGWPIMPTILAMLLKLRDLQRYDLSSLRYMTNTGAALPVEHIRRIREVLPGVRLFSMFGLTECKRVCYLPPEELDRRPGSVGKPMPDCEVAVVDADGNEVAVGETGELVVRGTNVMRGYWKDPALTARVYRRRPDTGETEMHSGDYFRRDADGYLYFLGRRDDMLKCRGERVSAKEVENVLCECPGVLEAAIVGVPHEVEGQTLVAFVTVDSGKPVAEQAILRFSQANLEPYAVPRRVVLVAELPRTAHGKIDKRTLQARAEEDACHP